MPAIAGFHMGYAYLKSFTIIDVLLDETNHTHGIFCLVRPKDPIVGMCPFLTIIDFVARHGRPEFCQSSLFCFGFEPFLLNPSLLVGDFFLLPLLFGPEPFLLFLRFLLRFDAFLIVSKAYVVPGFPDDDFPAF